MDVVGQSKKRCSEGAGIPERVNDKSMQDEAVAMQEPPKPEGTGASQVTEAGQGGAGPATPADGSQPSANAEQLEEIEKSASKARFAELVKATCSRRSCPY